MFAAVLHTQTIPQSYQTVENNPEINGKTKGTDRCSTAFISRFLLNKHDFYFKKKTKTQKKGLSLRREKPNDTFSFFFFLRLKQKV